MLLFVSISIVWLSAIVLSLRWIWSVCERRVVPESSDFKRLDLADINFDQIDFCPLTRRQMNSTPKDPFLDDEESRLPVRSAFDAETDKEHARIQSTARELFSELVHAADDATTERSTRICSEIRGLMTAAGSGFDGDRAAQRSGLVLIANVVVDIDGLELLLRTADRGVSEARTIFEACVPLVYPG